MTLEEAIEEIRDHGILIDFRIERGAKALRVIYKALKDYMQIKQEQERETNGWIRCSKRMPEEYIAVLLYGEKIGILKGFFSPYKGFYIADSGNTAVRKTEVTHWMPLPPKPEVKNNVD